MSGPRREDLGRKVREIWVAFAKEQAERTGIPAKPGHLTPWEELDAANREVDMRIGVELYMIGYRAGAQTEFKEARS